MFLLEEDFYKLVSLVEVFTGFMSVFKDRRSDSPFLFPSSSVERFDIAKILRFKATDDSFLCYSSYHNYILTTSSCSTV